MKGRTFLDSGSRPAWRGTFLSALVLLSLVTTCWGQRTTRPRLRSGRATQLKVIQLPTPETTSTFSLEQAIVGQQALELPTDLRLTFSEIGQLLWAIQGVAVPQAGAPAVPDALIPMKVYVILPDGIYLYSPSVHALQQLRDGDARASLAMTVMNQQAIAVGGCQILIAGSTADFSARFGTRAKNAMLLLAGQMAQSLQLQAVSLDLTYLAINSVDTTGIRRIARLDRALMPLYFTMIGYPPSRTIGPAATTPTQVTPTQVGPDVAAPEPDPASPPTRTLVSAEPVAKAVIIAPQRQFQDETFFQTKFALENASIDVVVASNRAGRIQGARGGMAEATVALKDIKVEDVDALVFIGGAGAPALASNARVQELVRQAVDGQKVLAASGTAALIPANSGVVRSAKITGLAAHQELFVLAGAVYTGAAVEKDGLLITSVGPLAATEFARTVAEALTPQEAAP